MRLKVGTEGFKGTSLSTLLIVSLMVLAISLLSVGLSSATPEGLTPRAPIYIYGNDDFTPANGVASGSGTVGDPYIIENWAIDASTAHGICIEDTDNYFVIRNCLVENCGGSYSGIRLHNVVNGKIKNNSSYGIYLFSSDNNTLSNNTGSISLEFSYNNTLSNNTCIAITLSSSDSNTLDNNTCENSSYCGIWLYDSGGNTLSNNTCENNRYDGIRIHYGGGNTLSNNTCENNRYGIRLWCSSSNTLFNNTCKNNGTGISLYSPSSSLIATSSNTLSGNICSNNSSGIDLYGSYRSTLSNNICENNWYYGINLYGSYLSTLSGNICSNNTYNFSVRGSIISRFDHDIDTSNLVDGRPVYYLVDNSNAVIGPSLNPGYVGLVRCDNIRVENLVLENNGQGILLVSTENSGIRNCVCSNNSCRGISLWRSSNNTLSNNTCSNNSREARDPEEGYGILLLRSSNNTLSNNICENNFSYGIGLSGSGSSLSNNTCSNNDLSGIVLSGSGSSLSNNTCSNNKYNGILLSGSGNTLSNNTCSNNTYGIYLYHASSYNTLNNNTCSNNGYGIYLNSSDNNTLANNTCSNNSNGIYLKSSSNSNTISSNTCSNNSCGIQLAFSSYNTLANNTCSNNSHHGIYLNSSDNNTLANNTCSNNSNGIYLKSSSNSNTISSNTCSNNSCGIQLAFSSYNTLANNTCSNNGVYGIYLYVSSDNNHIYHNNFMSNTIQAHDEYSNCWDDGYPSGGNYWSDYTGADNYRGENQDIPESDGIGDTPYNITGGANQDRYPLMNPVGITPHVAPALIWPANGSTTNDNTPTFDWSDVSDAAKYEIWVDNDADFSSPEILENVILSTHTPAAALPDENYSWRVRAFDFADNAGDYSSVWMFIIDTQPPGIQTLSQPADGSTTNDTTPTFDWSDVSDPSDVTYTLEIIGGLTKTGLTASTYTLTSAEALADGTYSWHVRAVDGASNVGEWSTTWSLTIETVVPPPPSPDFVLSISPRSGSVTQGESTVATITASAIDGYNRRVTLSASGTPRGTTISFSPSFRVPSFNSTMTVTTSWATPAGSYTIKITGTGADGKVHSTTYTLKVTRAPTEAKPRINRILEEERERREMENLAAMLVIIMASFLVIFISKR